MSYLNAQVTYDALGTFASPVTLTAAYSGNQKILMSRYMMKLHLSGKYTPNETNSHLLVFLEFSNDPIYGGSGLPTNWEPMTVQVATTTEIDVYTDSGYGTTSGIPFVVPGDKTSVDGTAISWSWDGDVNANWIRISLKEVTSAAFGTANVETTLLNGG